MDETWTEMEAILWKFDRKLLEVKLRKPLQQMQIKAQVRKRQLEFRRQKSSQAQGVESLIAIVDSDLELLREYLENNVDPRCREVWESQGERTTPTFVRAILLGQTYYTIEFHVAAITRNIEKMAARTQFKDMAPVLSHIGRAASKLKAFVGRYELEAQARPKQDIDPGPGGLEAARVNAEEDDLQKTPSRLVSRAPRPITPLGGTGWAFHRVKAMQIPPDLPYNFPNDLKPQIQLVMTEAVRQFPQQTQILQLCKHVVSKLTSHFRAAVQRRTILADLALTDRGIEGVLQCLLSCNCDSEGKRYELAQEARKSDEWLNFVSAVVEAQAVSTKQMDSTQKQRLTATVSSSPAARRLEAFLKSKGIGQTDFASEVGTTDRTLRAFRRTGKIRRDIFASIAEKMGTTPTELLGSD